MATGAEGRCGRLAANIQRLEVDKQDLLLETMQCSDSAIPNSLAVGLTL